MLEGEAVDRETKLVQQVNEWHADALDAAVDQAEEAQECLDYYFGDQWKEDVKAYVEGQLRPTITNNYILPTINLLNGMVWQNWKDIDVRNRRSAKKAVASVLSQLLKQAQDDCNASYEKVQMFEDGAITMHGYIECTRNFERDRERGDIVLTKMPGYRNEEEPYVLEDPHCKHYDMDKDAKFVIVVEFIDKEKLEAEFPGKKEQLRDSTVISSPARSRSVVDEVVRFYFGASSDSTIWKYRYARQKTYWKETIKTALWTDGETGEMAEVSGKDLSRARKSVKAWPERFSLSDTRPGTVLHLTQTVGGVFLKDEEQPMGEGVTWFPVFRFVPFFKEGRKMGIVKNLKSPQDEANKRESQALDHLNRSSNSGKVFEEGTIKNEADVVRTGGRGGVNVIMKKNVPRDKWPLDIYPKPISAGHIMMSEKAPEKIKNISGVNTAMQGQDTRAGQSGIALQLQTQQGTMMNEPVQRNFDYTNRIMGRFMLDLILKTDVYGDDEVLDIVDDELWQDRKLLKIAAEELRMDGVEPPEMPPEPNPMEIQVLDGIIPEAAASSRAVLMKAYEESVKRFQGQMQEYQAKLTNKAQEIVLGEMREVDSTKLGLEVTESRHAPTKRLQRLLEMKEFQEAFPGTIPPEVAVKASDLEYKEEILENIQEMKQMAMAQEQVAR